MAPVVLLVEAIALRPRVAEVAEAEAVVVFWLSSPIPSSMPVLLHRTVATVATVATVLRLTVEAEAEAEEAEADSPTWPTLPNLALARTLRPVVPKALTARLVGLVARPAATVRLVAPVRFSSSTCPLAHSTPRRRHEDAHQVSHTWVG